jgi:glycosyltransferase involved in cell wall biosynthesis
MQFKIVTPTRNSSATIERTVRSVLSQACSGTIRYHIQDCSSTDDTVAIVSKWIDILETKGNPLGGSPVSMTVDSRNDKGMYDAINIGFETIGIDDQDDSWLSWINSDDIYCDYSFRLIEKVSLVTTSTRWIGGSAAVMIDQVPVSVTQRTQSSELIKQGLADGIHFDFVQQEGTFFKQSLYNECGGKDAFGGLKYAGDWNLWRMFAYRAELLQICNTPLAYFVISDDQLSKKYRDKYMAEIDSKLLPALRSGAALSLSQSKISYYSVNFNWKTGEPSVKRSTKTPELKPEYITSLARHANSIKDHMHLPADITSEIGSLKTGRYIDGNITIYNKFWQYPAITEKKAAELSAVILHGFRHVGYLGFPWATLIDLLNANKVEAEGLIAELNSLGSLARNSKKRLLTVCQHIHCMRYLHLFEAAGITDLFWSHAPRQIVKSRIRVHAFPLYAVNYSRLRKPWHERAYIVNFVGAKAEQWYLTETRNYILDEIQPSDQCIISGNLQWFFNNIVYEKQISGKTMEVNDTGSKDMAEYYSFVLGESIFTLCPSGTGPNTIRLWESIASGSIPIIMSDHWMPPGDERLWRRACIFLPDNREGVRSAIASISSVLKNPAQLSSMQESLKELFLLYGPETFVTNMYELASRYEGIVGSLANSASQV